MCVISSPCTLYPEVQDLKKRAFVLAFARTGNKAQAARVAGINPDTPYSRQWRRDLALQAAVGQAKEVAADLIEEEAYRRAVHGVQVPVGWYRGKPGGMVRKYSDPLAIFLLKGLRPEKYKGPLRDARRAGQHQLEPAAGCAD